MKRDLLIFLLGGNFQFLLIDWLFTTTTDFQSNNATFFDIINIFYQQYVTWNWIWRNEANMWTKSSQLIKQWALSVTKVNRREREKHANKSEEKRMVQSSILAFIDNSTVSFVRFRIEYEKNETFRKKNVKRLFCVNCSKSCENRIHEYQLTHFQTLYSISSINKRHHEDTICSGMSGDMRARRVCFIEKCRTPIWYLKSFDLSLKN